MSVPNPCRLYRIQLLGSYRPQQLDQDRQQARVPVAQTAECPQHLNVQDSNREDGGRGGEGGAYS